MFLVGVQWQERGVSAIPICPSEFSSHWNLVWGRLADLDNGICERQTIDIPWSEIFVSSCPRRFVCLGNLFS